MTIETADSDVFDFMSPHIESGSLQVSDSQVATNWADTIVPWSRTSIAWSKLNRISEDSEEGALPRAFDLAGRRFGWDHRVRICHDHEDDQHEYEMGIGLATTIAEQLSHVPAQLFIFDCDRRYFIHVGMNGWVTLSLLPAIP